jgi:hypothetical protein
MMMKRDRGKRAAQSGREAGARARIASTSMFEP